MKSNVRKTKETIQKKIRKKNGKHFCVLKRNFESSCLVACNPRYLQDAAAAVQLLLLKLLLLFFFIIFVFFFFLFYFISLNVELLIEACSTTS